MLDHPAVVAIVAGGMSLLASSGFWGYILHRTKSSSAERKLILALAYDKIVALGLAYIDRGWISKDEYEELLNNLFQPYKELGGNGTAEKVMGEVTGLSFRTIRLAEIVIKGNKTE